MSKKQINIRQAVRDIRAGMDDYQLMDKYRLAARGLQSLFSKLVEIGALQPSELHNRMPGFTETAVIAGHVGEPPGKSSPQGQDEPTSGRTPPLIRAKDAIRDIREGMHDSELMRKYRLSSSGLQDLFDQLLQRGLIKQYEIDERMASFDSTVDVRETVDKLKLDWPAPVVAPDKAKTSPVPEPKKAQPVKRSINLNNLVKDIRLGMDDRDLMEKYQLPRNELQRAFRQLVDAGAVTMGEIYGRSSLHLSTITIPGGEPDEDEAHYLAFPVPIYESSDPATVGRIRHVKERRIGTIGINARTGDVKSLVVSPERFVNMAPFSFEAVCLWFRSEAEGEYAGFEITEITEDNLRNLDRLVQMLTFGD